MFERSVLATNFFKCLQNLQGTILCIICSTLTPFDNLESCQNVQHLHFYCIPCWKKIPKCHCGSPTAHTLLDATPLSSSSMTFTELENQTTFVLIFANERYEIIRFSTFDGLSSTELATLLRSKLRVRICQDIHKHITSIAATSAVKELTKLINGVTYISYYSDVPESIISESDVLVPATPENDIRRRRRTQTVDISTSTTTDDTSSDYPIFSISPISRQTRRRRFPFTDITNRLNSPATSSTSDDSFYRNLFPSQ